VLFRFLITAVFIVVLVLFFVDIGILF